LLTSNIRMSLMYEFLGNPTTFLIEPPSPQIEYKYSPPQEGHIYGSYFITFL